MLWCIQVLVEREQGHQKLCPIFCKEIKIFIKIIQFKFYLKLLFDTKGPQWYYNNVASCDHSLIVREALYNNLPDRWVGRNSLGLWPPRVLILRHWNFYFWGYTKNRGDAEIIRDQDQRRGKELT